MLRKSTGFSDDRKRVGVSRGKETCSGLENWRCVATARFSIASDGGVGLGEDVGIGGWLEAIERRRLMRGSEE